MDSDNQPSPTTTASASDAVISNPLIAQFATIDDLSPDLSSLQDLAAHGSWRAILDKVDSARKLSLLRHPHHHLIYLSFAVLALTKLRRYEAAATELASLDDFDSSEYRYESYPLTYPNRSGSMVPFSLRWLHAEIPIKLGKREETLDRLYVLLDFVRSKLNQKHGSTDLVVSEGVWKRREGFVMNSIVGHHLTAKEGGVCLSLIKDLIDRGHFDALLLSKLGYVQMHVGDLEGAKSSFNRIEGMLKEGEYELLSEKEMKNLVGRNKALMFLVGKDYVSAVREYEECIERDGSDVVAINNKALCLMYLRDLSDSIKVLENALERAPTVALNETLVVNLCSMYELAYVNHSDIKKTLSTWIAQVAPDDFDSSCTRA